MSISKNMYGIEFLEEFRGTFECSANEDLIHNFTQDFKGGYALKYNYPTFSII